MSDDLRSAGVPPAGPDDWVRGDVSGTVIIEYADFECPFCAVMSARLAGAVGVGRVFRHFPVTSAHPRALAAACAAEAAGAQGRFWEMHDALFADQARLEDPHLWDRARTLGLDVARFDADRRGPDVGARVNSMFRAGVRAGVVTTPTLFVSIDGAPPTKVDTADLDHLLG